MRIIITGATGYMGSQITPILAKEHELLIVVRNKYKTNLIGFNLSEKGNLQTCTLDDNDLEDTISRFNPEIVIHTATHYSMERTPDVIKALIESNVLFGSLLLSALGNSNIKYFINIGTLFEYKYDNSAEIPSCFYAASKSAFKRILAFYQETYRFKWINAVLYNAYGENRIGQSQKKVINYIIESLYSKTPVKMTLGEQKMDFIHVQDICCFIEKLVKNIRNIKENYTLFHVGTGKSTSIHELSKITERVTGLSPNISWGELPYREGEIMYSCSPQKSIDIIDWKAEIPIEEGVRRLWKYIGEGK